MKMTGLICRGLFLGDDLDHDEEIKYSAVRRDTDNSKYKTPFTNVPSSTCYVDSFNRTVNIDPKDSLACSSTMVQKYNFFILMLLIKYSIKSSKIYFDH
jgi:hypothetical protein